MAATRTCGPVWLGVLPYVPPDVLATGAVLRKANVAAGTFAMHAVDGQWPPMPREGGFCFCGGRWTLGSSEHFDPTNRLSSDKDPQMGPCLDWLCVRIRAARGPCGDRTAPNGSQRPVAVPSEPYEE